MPRAGSRYEIDGHEVDAFTVNFLWMVVGLWAKGFPDLTIQGVSRKRALRMTEEVTGRTFPKMDFVGAFQAIEELQLKIQVARNAEATALGLRR